MSETRRKDDKERQPVKSNEMPPGPESAHTLTQDHPTARVKWMQCKKKCKEERGHRGRSVA